MANIERMIGYAIAGGIGLLLIYRIISTPQPTTMVAQPTTPEAVDGYVPTSYPAPYPVIIPTPTPTGEPEEETWTMQESLNMARDAVESGSIYVRDDCYSLMNTGAGQLRTPGGYWFTFSFTCPRMGMMPIVTNYTSRVDVVRGIITNLTLTPVYEFED